jgi:hypothetical protein
MEEGFDEVQKTIYRLAPRELCTRPWLSEKDLAEAAARFGEEPLITDADEDLN